MRGNKKEVLYKSIEILTPHLNECQDFEYVLSMIRARLLKVTRAKPKPPLPETRICANPECNKEFPLNAEYFHRNKGKFQYTCKPCSRLYFKGYRDRVNEIKKREKLARRKAFIEKYKVASSPIGVDIQADAS